MSVVLATGTFYRSEKEVRALLALRTIQEAVRCGYNIVVIDRGSYPEFRSQAVQMGATLLDEQARGMGPSRRQAMAEAAKLAGPTGVIVWIDPEKHPLVQELHHATAQVLNGEADIVIVGRKSLDSLPPEQKDAEHLGALAFQYLTGLKADVHFGPRVIGEWALRFFLEYAGEYGDKWDVLYIPVLRAMKAGLNVVSVEVDYIHPPEQTAEETGNIDFLMKRIEQIHEIVLAEMAEAQELGLHP